MSTDTTSADKPVSSAGSAVTPTLAPAVDKGKGKANKPEEAEEEDDDEDEDEDEMEEDDDDDDEEEDGSEIDPTAILASGRRTRGIKVDYTSKEALTKAGLGPEGEASGEEDDDDAMKH